MGREGRWGSEANRKTPIKEAGGIEPILTVSTDAALAATVQAAVALPHSRTVPSGSFPSAEDLAMPTRQPVVERPQPPQGLPGAGTRQRRLGRSTWGMTVALVGLCWATGWNACAAYPRPAVPVDRPAVPTDQRAASAERRAVPAQRSSAASQSGVRQATGLGPMGGGVVQAGGEECGGCNRKECRRCGLKQRLHEPLCNGQCGGGGSGCPAHCPVRPSQFGFYPTTWRQWPGQQVRQVAHLDIEATPVQPPRSEVPGMNDESRGNPNIDPAEEKATADANAAEDSQQRTGGADGKSAAAADNDAQREIAPAVSKALPPEPLVQPPSPAGGARWLGRHPGAGVQAGWSAASGEATGPNKDPVPVAELEVDGRWHSDAVPRRVPRRVPLQPLGNPLR